MPEAVTAATIKRLEALKPGHVVESFKIGNTRIKICDDCCVRTQAEIDEILRRCARIALDAYAAAEGGNT